MYLYQIFNPRNLFFSILLLLLTYSHLDWTKILSINKLIISVDLKIISKYIVSELARLNFFTISII